MSTTIIKALIKELNQEAQVTRKMLERIPDDKFQWQPHPKSMTIQRLATHIAELPGWVSMILTTDELDFANNPYQQETITNTADLLHYFQRSLALGNSELEKTIDEQLLPNWTLRNGETILSLSTRGEFIRTSYCQIVHHRAQLGVYLRLLDIPIPGSYGPSADDHSF